MNAIAGGRSAFLERRWERTRAMLTVYWIMFGLGVSFTLVSALLSGGQGADADAPDASGAGGAGLDGHALDAPSAEVHLEAPAAEAPALDAPAAEVHLEAPAVEAPSAEAPAVEAPVPAAHAEAPAAGSPLLPAHVPHAAPHADMRAAMEHLHNALSPALTATSPLCLSVFCAAFGGFGLIWTKMFGALNVALGAGASLAVAVGLAWGTLTLFNRVFASVQSDSTVRIDSLPGLDAVVTLDIPPGGVGTVTYEASGRRHSVGARAIAGRSFRRGERVSIVRADQGIVHVDHPLDRPHPLPEP